MNNLLTTLLLFAEDAPVKEAPPVSPLVQFLPMILIVFFFYFIMIRPQRKQRAERDKALSELKKNDRIVTIGGIIGTIASISDQGQEITIKIDDNSRLKVRRSAVQGIYEEEKKDESN